MKTKKEILYDHYDLQEFHPKYEEQIFNAMEEYAEQTKLTGNHILDWFQNEQGEYTVTLNEKPICSLRRQKEAKWLITGLSKVFKPLHQ